MFLRPVSCLLLSVLTASAGIAEPTYYSVTLAGKKAGYTRVQVAVQGGMAVVTSDCLIKIAMLGAPFDMQYQAIATYARSSDRLPLQYDVTMTVGPQNVTAKCRFNGNKVEIDSIANGVKAHKSATLPVGCMILEGNLPETFERILRVTGWSKNPQTVQVFIPTSGGPLPLKIKWSSQRAVNVEIGGQTLDMDWDPATKSLIAMHEPVQKALFRRADKDAMKDLEGYEAAARAFAVSNVMFDDPERLDSVTLDLNANVAGGRITAESLRSPTQSFDGTVVKNTAAGKMTIRKFRYDGSDSAAYPLPASARTQYSVYLKPGPMVECDDPEIRMLAKKVTAGSKNVWQATERIGKWVHENIRYKITGTGAKACLTSKEGDCGPHTWLSIALLRAAGIPATIMGGALYSGILGGSFGQHYWTRVWVGGKSGWIPIDTTSGEIGTLSPTHITLWNTVSGIGSLSVKVVDYSPKPKASAASAESKASRRPLALKPDERWKFVYKQNGKEIGSETARVEEVKPDGSARISYRMEVTVPQGHAVMTGEMTLGPDAAPAGFTMKAETAGIVQTVTTSASGGKVKAVVEAAGQKVDRSADLPPNGYLGAAQTILPWDLMIRSRYWLPGQKNDMTIFLIDALRSEKLSWSVLREEEVKAGGEKIACLVIGISKNAEQFFVRKDNGQLIRAVHPAAGFVVEKQL